MSIPAPTRQLAITLACRDEGVTSLQLAALLHVSTASAAARLGEFEEIGYLKSSGSGGPGNPYVYRVTTMGRNVLAGWDPRASAANRYSFGPLIACWGIW